jgi:glucosylglycerate synthase
MTRCLYGHRIRQPIGGDFGFSGALAEHYVEQHVWESDVARFGIDIWMTTEAIASGARVCQSFLGAKIHNPKDPAADLAGMLMQVVGAIFSLMEQHERIWLDRMGSQPVALFGFQYGVGVEPIHVNVDGMVQSFRQGLADLASVWGQMLSTATIAALKPLADCPLQAFRVPDRLWAHALFDAAIAYHRRVMPEEHLLKALTPLYLGRTASFVLETQALTTAEAEERIDQLCHCFEDEKRYLVSRWKDS